MVNEESSLVEGLLANIATNRVFSELIICVSIEDIETEENTYFVIVFLTVHLCLATRGFGWENG